MASPGLPASREMMVWNLDCGLAIGLNEVGDEYLSKNSSTPALTASKVNSTSDLVFPGATKMTVVSSSSPS